jgi:hypothetical protein
MAPQATKRDEDAVAAGGVFAVSSPVLQPSGVPDYVASRGSQASMIISIEIGII